MEEIEENFGSSDAQNTNEIAIEAEVDIEIDEERSIFKTLTVAQIENEMNQFIDKAIEYIKPNVLVSQTAFLPLYLG